MLFNTGQVLASESLFTYPEGKTAADYAFPNHRPIFMEEIPLTAYSPELREFCKDDRRCLFDADQTGTWQVGKQGLDLEEEMEKTTEIQGEKHLQTI